MSACRAGTPRVFRPNPVRHFSQCRGGTLKLAFRLFPWRGGSLNACRAGTPRVFRPNPVRHFSQCRWGTLKLAFRTLSMAWRLVVRLQGGQQCRHTTEIRSEVSRPPDLFRTASSRNRKVSSLLLSGFGRAGGYGKRFWAFSRACSAPFRWIGTPTRPIIVHRVRSRWALPKPAKEP